MSGRFITLEGGEGAGKSTQAALLASWLREQGKAVVETREPGGTQIAEAIRNILMEPDISVTPTAEAYLFAAARAGHVERLIAPALSGDHWVICDRFLDSSVAYQGVAADLGPDAVRQLNEMAVGEIRPDLTILLRLDPASGAVRAKERDGENEDRFGARNLAYHWAVAEAFDEMAAAEPDRFVVIDASGDIASVAGAIRDTVKARLP